MKADIFKLEEWMNTYSPMAKYDLSGTCISPLSIKDLLIIGGITNASEIINVKMTYGDIHGSDRLKKAISDLYEKQNLHNITVTHGAIGANKSVYEALINRGDEVITVLPTYQQHCIIPKSLGATVKTVFLREENNWNLHLKDIEDKITPKTKLICITNPNNPTGNVISDEILEKLCKLAAAHRIWILSDEVYRGLNLFGKQYSTSVADIYEQGISVGSMSKTYSLPGLRVGWICGREDLITEVNRYRETSIISVSILDDYFASLALENKDKIATRNFEIMNAGYKVLQNWLNEEIYVKATLPQAGTTVLLRYKKEISSRKLCREFQAKTGIALLPGETMDLEGTVRLCYSVEPSLLQTCLKTFSKYLR